MNSFIIFGLICYDYTCEFPPTFELATVSIELCLHELRLLTFECVPKEAGSYHFHFLDQAWNRPVLIFRSTQKLKVRHLLGDRYSEYMANTINLLILVTINLLYVCCKLCSSGYRRKTDAEHGYNIVIVIHSVKMGVSRDQYWQIRFNYLWVIIIMSICTG